MKLSFAVLCLGFAAVLSSCQEKNEPESGWFPTPPQAIVSGTSVVVTCSTTLNSGVLASYPPAVAYAPAGSGDYTVASDAQVEGNMVSCRLEGLEPQTEYVYYVFVDLKTERLQSASGNFTTGIGSTDPDPDPTPDPDPDPAPGDGKYSGWAELPAVKQVAGDYYYAYHICPDVYVPDTQQKRRNYAVCYSDKLKTAVWVSAPMHDCYAKKNTDRTDAYKADPQIGVSQPGSWTGYTRGHMLGSAERLVSEATNEQVFYYSNIAPQLGTKEYFNTGGGAWNTLEDWVDGQWKGQSDTTYQVIGSYWKNKNKVVNGTTVPTHYYKVLLRTKGHKNKWVSNCSRDELQCIAIMVEHKAYAKADVPKPAQYQAKGMLYTVAQVEELTGVEFFTNVPNAPKDAYNPADWGL